MWLLIGYLSISLTLGFLLGSSNTPVIGVFITGFLALVGTVVGAKYLFDFPDSQQNLMPIVGKSLFVLSLGVASGTIAGEKYRNGIHDRGSRSFPWSKDNAPTTTHEAIDWIALSEKLSNLGYSQSAIIELYRIRVVERKELSELIRKETAKGVDPFNITKLYDSTNPFNTMLGTVEAEERVRGPASIE
ncbi:hypothetical protein [Thiosocius teredinicola]|uniref:hypothetical protein n=1 Tax=Thiosocius teredinicola TaxID=1973002 RepID=UPI000990C72F